MLASSGVADMAPSESSQAAGAIASRDEGRGRSGRSEKALDGRTPGSARIRAACPAICARRDSDGGSKTPQTEHGPLRQRAQVLPSREISPSAVLPARPTKAACGPMEARTSVVPLALRPSSDSAEQRLAPGMTLRKHARVRSNAIGLAESGHAKPFRLNRTWCIALGSQVTDVGSCKAWTKETSEGAERHRDSGFWRQGSAP